MFVNKIILFYTKNFCGIDLSIRSSLCANQAIYLIDNENTGFQLRAGGSEPLRFTAVFVAVLSRFFARCAGPGAASSRHRRRACAGFGEQGRIPCPRPLGSRRGLSGQDRLKKHRLKKHLRRWVFLLS